MPASRAPSALASPSWRVRLRRRSSRSADSAVTGGIGGVASVVPAPEAPAVPVARHRGEGVDAAPHAGLLGVQQRAVGAGDEVGRRHPVVPHRHAGRGARRRAVDELRDRGGDAVHGAPGDLHRGLLVGGADEQRELVAAVARGDVIRADAAAQRGADAPQDGVAGEVPVLLVDLLEVVEVDQHQRGRVDGVARGADDLAVQVLVQRRVVEAAGQRVGLRGAGEARRARWRCGTRRRRAR